MYLQFSTNTTRLCLCVPTLRALAPTRCRKRKEKKRSSGCNNIRWRSDRGAGLYRQLAPIVAACRLLLLLSKQASSSSSPPGRGLALISSAPPQEPCTPRPSFPIYPYVAPNGDGLPLLGGSPRHASIVSCMPIHILFVYFVVEKSCSILVVVVIVMLRLLVVLLYH